MIGVKHSTETAGMHFFREMHSVGERSVLLWS